MSWDVVPSGQVLDPLRKFSVEIDRVVKAEIDYPNGAHKVVYNWADAMAGKTYSLRIRELSKETTSPVQSESEWDESPWTNAVTVECGTAVTAETLITIPFRHDLSLVPQPPGLLTNSCWTSKVSESENLHTCRYIRAATHYISKDSDRIYATSANHSRFGRMLILDSGNTYEACTSHDPNTWKCLYLGTNHWNKRSQSTVTWDFYYRAVKKVNPIGAIQCALALIVTWLKDANLADIIDSCGDYFRS